MQDADSTYFDDLYLTKALNAHTPCAPCTAYRSCSILQLGHMLSTTFTYTYEASRAHEQKAHTYA